MNLFLICINPFQISGGHNAWVILFILVKFVIENFSPNLFLNRVECFPLISPAGLPVEK
jgi:hypothetical protein